jgi:hypothetical protein
MANLIYRTSAELESFPDAFPDAVEPEHSVANIDTTDLESLHRRLLQIEWDDVQMAVAMRQDGRPQRLTTALLNEPLNLTDGHVFAGRLQSAEEQKLHKFGLVMGMIACNDFHAKHVDSGKRLQADNPKAFERAHHKLYKTDADSTSNLRRAEPMFAQLPDGPWYRERYRELAYTGTDAFSTLYAMTRGHIEALIADAPNESWYPVEQVPESTAATAIVTGMIDARRFFLNYQRNIDGRREYVNTFDVQAGRTMPIPLGDEPFKLPTGMVAPEALTLLDHGRSEWGWRDIGVGDQVGKLLTQSTILQIGPSTFQRGHLVCVPDVPADFAGTGLMSMWSNPTDWTRTVVGSLQMHNEDSLRIVPSTSLNAGQAKLLVDMRNVQSFPRSVMLPQQPPTFKEWLS